MTYAKLQSQSSVAFYNVWPVRIDMTNHERKDDRDLFDGFDDPEANETDNLNGGEEVNTSQWYVTQVHVVRLVLGWH